MRVANIFLLGAVAVVLMAAVGSAGWQASVSRDQMRRIPPVGKLSGLLPSNMPGVKIEDLPLGPSEYVDEQAKEKMDYDDVVYRAYTTHHGTFSVYIGYWAQGKRSPSHVAAHIPDRCWTLAGMICLEREAEYYLALDALPIAPAYWRRFKEPHSAEIETVFWHVVGQGFYDYGGRLHDYTPPLQRAGKVIRDMFSRREDQYFIRIVSTERFASFAHDQTFNTVMGKVAELGLRRP